LAMVERALGFSPQEIGASASHQQSATEVVTINANTSQRLQLTGSYIDEAMAARARMLYEAVMAYDSDEVFVSVADIDKKGRELLNSWGFEIKEDGEHTIGVAGDKKKLMLNGFGMFRDPTSRVNEPAVAQLMTAFLDRILSNQAIVGIVGPKFIFDRLNEIAEYFGLPTDFRLPADVEKRIQQMDGQNQAEQQQQAAQAMQQIAAQVAQQVVGEAVAGLGQDVVQKIAGPLAEKQAQIEQALTQFAQQTQASLQGAGQALQQFDAQMQQITQATQMTAGASEKNAQNINQLAQAVAQLNELVNPQPVA